MQSSFASPCEQLANRSSGVRSSAEDGNDFLASTLGRFGDLRKLPWSCLALRTQGGLGPVPSVAILCGSVRGQTVKPGRWISLESSTIRSHAVRRMGSVLRCQNKQESLLCHRYRDHCICSQAALADLAVATFHSDIKPGNTLSPPLACRGTSP